MIEKDRVDIDASPMQRSYNLFTAIIHWDKGPKYVGSDLIFYEK